MAWKYTHLMKRKEKRKIMYKNKRWNKQGCRSTLEQHIIQSRDWIYNPHIIENMQDNNESVEYS